MSKVKRLSCVNCGIPFEVYPPDDNHPYASLEKPNEASGSIIEMNYDCENQSCMHPTTLYWYKHKISFSVA